MEGKRFKFRGVVYKVLTVMAMTKEVMCIREDRHDVDAEIFGLTEVYELVKEYEEALERNPYYRMQKRLEAVPDLEDRRDDDAPISIWLGSLAAYNAGYYVGRWISLPADEDALRAAYNIVTEDGRHDFFIADHEGVYKQVDEYSDPFKLNEIAEQLEDLSETEQEIINWLLESGICTDFDDALEHYADVTVGDRDTIMGDYMELKFSDSLETLKIFERVYPYIDWDYVWNEIEHSAATHYNGDGEYFIYWQ